MQEILQERTALANHRTKFVTLSPSSSEKDSPFSVSEEVPSIPPKARARLESRQTATSSYGLCWTRVAPPHSALHNCTLRHKKELHPRPSSTTLLIFSSKTDTACSAPAQDHVQIHNASTTLLSKLYSKLYFGEKEIQSKRCGSRQWFSTLLNGRNLKDSSPKKSDQQLSVKPGEHNQKRSAAVCDGVVWNVLVCGCCLYF